MSILSSWEQQLLAAWRMVWILLAEAETPENWQPEETDRQ